jgi:hypothetical protein
VDFIVRVIDIAANPVASQTYGFVDSPAGFFLINGQPVIATSVIVSNSNTVTFQFNASKLPASVSNVNIIVANLTSAPGTKTLCYIGSTGCFATPYTGSGTFNLFPSDPIYFLNGQYNITGTFSCTGCALPSYRVLSLIGGFGTLTLPNIPFQSGPINLLFTFAGLIAIGADVVLTRKKHAG